MGHVTPTPDETAIAEYCARIRAMHVAAETPITSQDDPRVAELSNATPYRDEEWIRSSIPEFSQNLAEMHFEDRVAEVTDVPLPMPAWANELEVYAGDYPHVLISFRKTVLDTPEGRIRVEQAFSVTVDDALEPDGVIPAGNVTTETTKLLVDTTPMKDMLATPLTLSLLGEALHTVADAMSNEAVPQ
ncbi:hypothetical protein [Microbacterium marinilacus]|nr:hypothetical protein [Microbacterium marinilacus]MBY0687011.1 hypothetical protein [Microbacterium marinilacus]